MIQTIRDIRRTIGNELRPILKVYGVDRWRLWPLSTFRDVFIILAALRLIFS